jgi:hypothetical protein
LTPVKCGPDGRLVASAQTIERLKALCAQDATELQASARSDAPVDIPLDYRDAAIACGTMSDAFNGGLIRQAILACARPGQPDFDEKAPFVIAALREIAPRNALEAMRASLAVAAHAAAMTSYRVARSCGSGLAPTFFARGDQAAVVANALIEAIERGRGESAQEVIVMARQGRSRGK